MDGRDYAFVFNLPLLGSVSGMDLTALEEGNTKTTSSDRPGLDLTLLHQTLKRETRAGGEELGGAAKAIELSKVTVGVGSSVVAFTAAWALRAAATAGSMFASVPLWRGLDVLPLVMRRRLFATEAPLTSADKIFELKEPPR